MNNKEKQLITNIAEEKHTIDKTKLELQIEEDGIFLNSNWDEINKKREEQNLPKLGSDPKKKAYAKQQVVEKYNKIIDLELEYRKHRMEYEILIANKKESIPCQCEDDKDVPK